MPHIWNNLVVVTKDELVPVWFRTENTLKSTIARYADKPYGIKKVQKGGNGRQLLISFDSLDAVMQDGLGDPRKLNHILDRFYKTDGKAVDFFKRYRFADGTYLDIAYQERYIINANVLQAVVALRAERESQRRTKGHSLKGILNTLLDDVVSFNEILEKKYGVKHTIPSGDKQFKKVLNDFDGINYESLISGKHKNKNNLKVNDLTIELLNNLFAGQPDKPTATEVHRQYESFLSGYLQVINTTTGEEYQPTDFKTLCANTVTGYMAQWTNKIGTHAKRSGDRQKFMSKYKPYHSLIQPKFSGSIISIDDRQPPFKMPDGNRIWFYNGIDLASEAFTCWVYGKSKEGIIVEFYRQLVRNYATWGLNLPNELEAEMSLNSSFVNTFLREGEMFSAVRIEANNARGKRIEAFYKPLRYQYEKKRIGWLARPHALSEANQLGGDQVPTIQYGDIVRGCLQDIEDWNNAPHSVHKEMSRWDVFVKRQHPDLKPTNYAGILPHIGHKTPTSCNVGIIHLNNSEFLLADDGKIALGKTLISLMQQVEGKDVDIYWLDDDHGDVLKALVFIGGKMICEAMQKPRYQRARLEQTDEDIQNRQIMSSYVATIEAFGRRQRQSIDPILIIDNTPKPSKSFVMPGLHKGFKAREDNGDLVDDTIESEELQTVETVYPTFKQLKDRL